MGNNWGKEDAQEGGTDLREGTSINELEGGRFVGEPQVPQPRFGDRPGDEPPPQHPSNSASSVATVPSKPAHTGHMMEIDASEEASSLVMRSAHSDEDLVPTVFRWEHGGRQVYVTGTFNSWDKQIPMHQSGNDFTYIHNLKKGKHAFRFVVDDEWRFAPDQQTVADIEGRINNFIDVSEFDAYTGDENFLLRRSKSISGDLYTRDIPDLDEYTKDPPPLPPHLRHIILNKAPPVSDPNALPQPQHVALNHLYCTAIKDGTMVLGVTVRYRQTACTTVYYSCS